MEDQGIRLDKFYGSFRVINFHAMGELHRPQIGVKWDVRRNPADGLVEATGLSAAQGDALRSHAHGESQFLGCFCNCKIDAATFFRTSGHGGGKERQFQTFAEKLSREVDGVEVNIRQGTMFKIHVIKSSGNAVFCCTRQNDLDVIFFALFNISGRRNALVLRAVAQFKHCGTVACCY